MTTRGLFSKLFRSSKSKQAIDLAAVDRNFIELWLSKISEPVSQLPDTADPQTVSFVCQLAVMACLQETDRIPSDQDSALDFGMNFVAKLWPIIPIGAKKHLSTEAWGALWYVPWSAQNAAWHNLHVQAARKAFQSALEELLSEFPSLREDDCKELVANSPIFQVLRRESEAQLSCSRYLDYHFLDVFHDAQIQGQLGNIPEADVTTEEFTSRFIGKNVKGAFPQIGLNQ